MNSVYQDSAYVGNSILLSRLFQENGSLGQGVTAYGVLANLIAVHMDKIDRAAEYAGIYLAQKDIEEIYTEQYGKNGVWGRFKRLFTGSRKAYENQLDRRDLGFIKAVSVEGGIKLGSRVIQKWAGEREKYQCLDQVYRILLAYAREDPPQSGGRTPGEAKEDPAAYQKNLKRELNKIRNSFPLSASDRLKLSGISADGLDVFEADFPILRAEGSQELRENIAYLLYVLYAQKYGAATQNEPRLLEYYDLLGFRSSEAAELLRENKDSYDTITADQLRYLTVARGMVKSLEVSLPKIDVNAIAQRVTEMAEHDPYRIRQNKVLRRPVGEPKRIQDLVFEAPMLVINAGSTALAQLDMDDDAKESTQKKLTEWGIDQGAVKNIMENADEIKKESGDIQ